MRYLLLLFAVTLAAQPTLKSIVNASTDTTVSLATTAVTTFRVEFSIENLGSLSGDRMIWNFNDYPDHRCQISSGTLVMYCMVAGDGHGNGFSQIDLAGRTNIRGRWQRDATAGAYMLEVWNGDCTGYQSQQKVLTSVRSSFNHTGTIQLAQKMQMGFMRMYSTLDSGHGCPVDAPTATANWLDLRFENIDGNNSASDVSGRSQVLTLGSAAYTNSDHHSPVALVSGWSTQKPSFRAGTAFALNGETSVAFTGNGRPASYFWQQIAGPSVCDATGQRCKPAISTFSDRAAISPTVVAPVGGGYTYRLTVADASGDRAVADVAVGATATDSAHMPVVPDADRAWVLGGGLAHGHSDWPWFDRTEAAVADRLRTLMMTPPTETPGTGTLTAGASPENRIDGGYITNQAAPDGDGIIFHGAGTSFAGGDVGKRLAIIWDADGDGSFKGRRVVTVKTVTSATEIVISGYQLQAPPEPFLTGGLSWSWLDTTHDPWNSLDSGSNILGFYEAGLAIARLKTRSGLYKDQFSAFCETSWRFSLGSGYETPTPRNSGLHAIIACAVDPDYQKPPNMWQGIARLVIRASHTVGTSMGNQYSYNPTTTVTPGMLDVREVSYTLRPSALVARLYGKLTGDPGATSTWCGYLKNQVKNLWIAGAQTPTGASSSYKMWAENLYQFNDYPAAASPAGTGIFGTSPWRSAGLPAIALAYAYEALKDLNDNQGCADSDGLAAQIFTPSSESGLLNKVANYIWDYGRSADGGSLYSEGYESKVTAAATGSGTITVTNGSSTITGSGTSFASLFAPCNGSTYIAIERDWNDKRVYQVSACGSNTSLSINAPFAGATGTTSKYLKVDKSQSNCGPLSISTRCEPDQYSGRNLSADIAASAAWLSAYSTDNAIKSKWRDRALFYANKTFGGAAGGSGAAGTPTGSCSYARAGTVTVTNASTIVAGNGTAFTTQFQGCTGTTRILIGDSAGTWASPPGSAPNYYTFTVASCSSDSVLTLSAPWFGSTRTTGLFYSPEDPQWSCADGGTGNLGEILPSCSTNAAPCGENALVPKYGKSLGMASGAGDTPPMMALLATPSTPTSQTITLAFHLVSGATKYRATITLPNGKTTATVCSTSPCSLTIDTTMGGWPMLRGEHLDASDKVRASDDPRPLRF